MLFYKKQSEGGFQMKIKEQIAEFKQHQDEFHYTRLGVVCCFLKISFKRDKHYFCSQFVAELLKNADAISMKRASSLYLPNHFKKELIMNKQLLGISMNPV